MASRETIGDMPRVMLAVEAMRSRFELVLEGERPDQLQAAGEEAIAEILAAEGLLHPFAPSSDLARVRGSTSPVRVAGATMAFLSVAQSLSHRTERAFDLTATSGGQGFHLNEDDGTVQLFSEDGFLDPGALGKGWALERAADLLRDSGVRHAMLHGGTSSIVAWGSPDGCAGWTVAVCDPADSERLLETIVLRGEALSVSSNFLRPHIVDSKSGLPITEKRLTVVRAKSPTEAEALSTALLVVGEEGILALQQAFPEAVLKIYR